MFVKKTKNPRMCIACRCHGEPSKFFRIVRKPDGEVIIDDIGAANGRGAYLCRNVECIEFAKKHKKIEQALKTAIPDEIYEQLKIMIYEKKHDE